MKYLLLVRKRGAPAMIGKGVTSRLVVDWWRVYQADCQSYDTRKQAQAAIKDFTARAPQLDYEFHIVEVPS